MKILLIYSVAGGLGATIRHQLERIDADKYELLTITSTNPEHRVWQEKGYPVKYMTAEQFVLLRKSEEFYWIAKTEENQSFYGILKEDG